MNISPRLREQIDACRSGQADLALPELAELAQAAERDPAVAAELARAQRLDGDVRAALNDIAVPAGLAERLIAAAQTQTPAGEVSLPPSVERAEPLQRPRRMTRRNWLIAGSSLALVAVIALSIQAWRARQRVALDELADSVRGWLSESPANQWKSATAPRRRDRPGSECLPPLQWRRLPATSDWATSITAIDLSPPAPGMPKATLFVVKSAARFNVPTGPSMTTQLVLSGPFRATAWQRQNSNLLYILVVASDRPDALEGYLKVGPQA